MRFQATNSPTVTVSGEQIIVSVPSGGSKIELALSCDQAILLEHSTRRAVVELIETPRHSAEVLPFKRRRKGKVA